MFEQFFIGTREHDELANAGPLQGQYGALEQTESPDERQRADVGQSTPRAIAEDSRAGQENSRTQSLQFGAAFQCAFAHRSRRSYLVGCIPPLPELFNVQFSMFNRTFIIAN
jgi:hypothetical protein